MFYQVSRLLANPNDLTQSKTVVDQKGEMINVFPDEVALRVPLMLQSLTAIYAGLILITILLIGNHETHSDTEDDYLPTAMTPVTDDTNDTIEESPKNQPKTLRECV